MRQFLLFILLQCVAVASIAQPTYDAKRDFIWVQGTESGTADTVNYAYFDFRSDTLAFIGKRIKSHDLYQTNASICDTAGNLLLYSNGCVLVDSSHQLIEGADTINRGVRWKNYCDKGSDMTFGYVVNNGCWILPTAANKFKAIYVDLINSTAHTSGIRFADIAQNDVGNLIGEKTDTYLFQADLHSNKSAFVRHANGKDWWQINEAYQEHRYYLSHIDDTEQIKPTKTQVFNNLPMSTFHGGGQSCFSPDGTVYATIDARDQCQIFDFDRCKGELSNARRTPLPVPYDSVGAATGIAISPNSRFMYLMTLNNIWQYDLKASDIENSKIKVAQHDGYQVYLPWNAYEPPARFYQSQIGPDGKIYVFPTAGRRTFTVIDHPDLHGLGCNVIQHKYETLGLTASGTVTVHQPARFPNYRLGPVVGSPCDTITSSTHAPSIESKMVLRPNPASDYSVVDITISEYSAAMQLEVEVSGVGGAHIAMYQVPPYAALQRIETSTLPNGVYFVTLKSRGMAVKTEKLVVLRE
jgi:Secretion system C-terminal sorting domain